MWMWNLVVHIKRRIYAGGVRELAAEKDISNQEGGSSNEKIAKIL